MKPSRLPPPWRAEKQTRAPVHMEFWRVVAVNGAIVAAALSEDDARLIAAAHPFALACEAAETLLTSQRVTPKSARVVIDRCRDARALLRNLEAKESA